MSNKEKKSNDSAYNSGFGSRLHQALGGGNFREIASSLDDKGLKIDYDRLRRYINDERRPDFDTLIAFSDLTGVSTDWLLKGTAENKVPADSRLIAEVREELIDAGWSEITLDEIRGLRILAERRNESVQSIVKKLIAQGLSINDAFGRLIPVRTISLKDVPKNDLVDVDFSGELTDDAVLKETYGIVRLPQSLIPEKLFSDESVHNRDVYVYRIATKQLISEGLRPDDLIIAVRLQTSMRKREDIKFLDSIPVIYTEIGENKTYVGRSYRDSVTSGFLTRPLRSSHPIQKLMPGYLDEFKFIHMILVDFE